MEPWANPSWCRSTTARWARANTIKCKTNSIWLAGLPHRTLWAVEILESQLLCRGRCIPMTLDPATKETWIWTKVPTAHITLPVATTTRTIQTETRAALTSVTVCKTKVDLKSKSIVCKEVWTTWPHLKTSIIRAEITKAINTTFTRCKAMVTPWCTAQTSSINRSPILDTTKIQEALTNLRTWWEAAKKTPWTWPHPLLVPLSLRAEFTKLSNSTRKSSVTEREMPEKKVTIPTTKNYNCHPCR